MQLQCSFPGPALLSTGFPLQAAEHNQLAGIGSAQHHSGGLQQAGGEAVPEYFSHQLWRKSSPQKAVTPRGIHLCQEMHLQLLKDRVRMRSGLTVVMLSVLQQRLPLLLPPQSYQLPWIEVMSAPLKIPGRWGSQWVGYAPFYKADHLEVWGLQQFKVHIPVYTMTKLFRGAGEGLTHLQC